MASSATAGFFSVLIVGISLYGPETLRHPPPRGDPGVWTPVQQPSCRKPRSSGRRDALDGSSRGGRGDQGVDVAQGDDPAVAHPGPVFEPEAVAGGGREDRDAVLVPGVL